MATHQTRVEISQSVPPELEVGADIKVKVKLSCPQGCDLCGSPVRVLAANAVIFESELATHHEGTNETEGFALKAPAQVGEHTWTILFPRHEIEGTVHEESCFVIAFTTTPHATSMAVWDVPLPVVANRLFKVKVGVKCSAMCRLTGQLVDIRDEGGAPLGEARLGEAPWRGTSGLHVAEVELNAPTTEGIFAWSAGFSADGPGLPHEKVSATFGFRTARAPEHRVTFTVTDKETKVPLENVEVRLGVYRASTDAQGLARLELPGGVYTLEAWKSGYQTPSRTIEVTNDLAIQIEALCSPEKDPDDERVWM
jgi:hypothetical protein